jgi:hypothetical protein
MKTIGLFVDFYTFWSITWWVAEQAETERGNNKKNEADDEDKTPEEDRLG